MEQKQQKQYRTTIKSIDETRGYVVVAANAFNNVDSQGDVSANGSFKKTIENIKNIYWYKNHNPNETLGIITRLWEDDLFLNAEMKFNLDKEISRNMYSDYRFFQENNNEIKHSVGVTAIPDKIDYKDDVRIVKEWKLWELSSLTKWPSNELAGTHLVKSMNDIENLKQYFEWMSENGMHTDEFIRQTEDILKELKQKEIKEEPLTEALETPKEPDYSTLVDSINRLKL